MNHIKPYNSSAKTKKEEVIISKEITEEVGETKPEEKKGGFLSKLFSHKTEEQNDDFLPGLLSIDENSDDEVKKNNNEKLMIDIYEMFKSSENNNKSLENNNNSLKNRKIKEESDDEPEDDKNIIENINDETMKLMTDNDFKLLLKIYMNKPDMFNILAKFIHKGEFIHKTNNDLTHASEEEIQYYENLCSKINDMGLGFSKEQIDNHTI